MKDFDKIGRGGVCFAMVGETKFLHEFLTDLLLVFFLIVDIHIYYQNQLLVVLYLLSFSRLYFHKFSIIGCKVALIR